MSLSNISDYFQPDFYHFSKDSIILADNAVKIIEEKSSLKSFKIMDMCAGSGVVGLEIFQKCRNDLKIDFCEIQSDFEPYFDKNVMQLKSRDTSGLKFKNISIGEIKGKEFEGLYDLIVCNPPYFSPLKNRPSKDERRNICRLFVKDSLSILLEKIVYLLKNHGEALIINRDNIEEEVRKLCAVGVHQLEFKKILVFESFTLFLITVLHKQGS